MILSAATVIAVWLYVIKMTLFGREKFINRETETVEKITRIVICRLYTTVIGNAEIYHGNDEFYTSCETYNGKKTNCYIHFFTIITIHNDVVKHIAHIIGNRTYIHFTAATALIAAVNSFCRKTNGVNNFCLCQLFVDCFLKFSWLFQRFLRKQLQVLLFGECSFRISEDFFWNTPKNQLFHFYYL